MRKVIACIVSILVLASAAYAAEQPKITLNVRSAPIKDVVSQLTQQSGAAIVLDPKVQATVSLSLKDAEVGQAIAAISGLNNLVWKKLQFAKPTDDTVKLDQIKSGILALASMPMVGLSVEDPTAKTSAVFAKNLPSSPDTTNIKLPEGYSWTTVYVILASEPKEAKTATDSNTSLSADVKQRMMQMAKMTPEERRKAFADEMAAQMSLAPDVRQAIMADQMQARFNMDPQSQAQYRDDMRAVFQQMRAQNPNMGFGPGGGGHRHGGGGNNGN